MTDDALLKKPPFLVKKGETVEFNGVLTINGVVTTIAGSLIEFKIRPRNARTPVYTFTYVPTESGAGTLGNFKLTADSTNWATGEFVGEVKYTLPDGRVFYDETVNIVVQSV